MQKIAACGTQLTVLQKLQLIVRCGNKQWKQNDRLYASTCDLGTYHKIYIHEGLLLNAHADL